MLCRLLLMRHAKSSPAGEVFADHERPLDAKGVGDAPKMAMEILKAGYEPGLVLCSDSQRTLSTWALMAPSFSANMPVEKSTSLYNSNADTYLKFVAEQNFGGHTLLLIGHNPVVEDLIAELADKWVVMKPANIGVLETRAGSWQEALSQMSVWKLVRILSC